MVPGSSLGGGATFHILSYHMSIFEKYNTNPSYSTAADLAEHFYSNGMHEIASLFAARALKFYSGKEFLPECIKAVEILSISGFYSKDEKLKKLGHEAAEMLSLAAKIPAQNNELARKNLMFYTKRLDEIAKIERSRELKIPLKENWNALNPSVVMHKGKLLVIQRTVNYTIIDGVYHTPNNAPITTENWLLEIDQDTFDIVDAKRIYHPVDWPSPVYGEVLGFEDCRATTIGDQLWISATIREASGRGMCEIVTAKVMPSFSGEYILAHWNIQNHIRPDHHQKNWMPIINHGDYRFIYATYPTTLLNSEMGHITIPATKEFECSNHRGGSQVIFFEDGWLCLTHEVEYTGRIRNYLHRFVYFDRNFKIRRVSDRFKMSSCPIDFVAGMCWSNDLRGTLIISAGVNDNSSWLFEISSAEVSRLLDKKKFDNL